MLKSSLLNTVFPLKQILLQGSLFLALGAMLAACQTPPQNPLKIHHKPGGGFQNPGKKDPHGFGGFLKWQWDKLMGRTPKETDPPPAFKIVSPDIAYPRINPAGVRVTWAGHATFLLQLPKMNVLTDPHFSGRASPFSWVGPKRRVAAPFPLEKLPPIDVVLISHNHYDHLDEITIRGLVKSVKPDGPLFIVPLGLKPWMESVGAARVVELDWWASTKVGDLTIHAVPAQHFSGRSPFDTNEVLWAGFVVKHPDFSYYHTGDTGYGPFFKEIGKRLGPFDLASIAIGAYEPRWFMAPMHINPAEAVQVHQDVKARRSVGMHWGTFKLTDEPMKEPPKALKKALEKAKISSETFFVMEHGETRVLKKGHPNKNPERKGPVSKSSNTKKQMALTKP